MLFVSPQLATRLLAHKIQSPQEWEAMQALMVRTSIKTSLWSYCYIAMRRTVQRSFFFCVRKYVWTNQSKWTLNTSQVLETCVKICGKRFHTEVGKFRFLNELIKVVSPKVMMLVLYAAVTWEVLCRDLLSRYSLICVPEEILMKEFKGNNLVMLLV